MDGAFLWMAAGVGTVLTLLAVRRFRTRNQAEQWAVPVGAPASGPRPVNAPSSRSAKTMTEALGGGEELELVWIPAGTFMMGSPDSDDMAFRDEKPQHEVTISRGFWLGKFAVTQAQWEAVMGSNPSMFKGASRPVEQVSWEDVQGFLTQLNQAAGAGGYRLPSEAEWEYACRAGTMTRYSWGDDASELGEYAWWGRNSGGSTQPVGQKKPNPWGLYDMHGNVEERVLDWDGPYTSGAQTDPTGLPSGSLRVNRGGSWWLDVASRFRGANRHGYSPGRRNAFAGFRLARMES